MEMMVPTSRRYDDVSEAFHTSHSAPSLSLCQNASPTDVHGIWIDRSDVYRLGAAMPTMPKSPSFVNSPRTFKPITTPRSMRDAINTSPRTSPFEYKKIAPSLSHGFSTTPTTIDTASSVGVSTSSHHGFFPVWVPPRDVAVCRFLEKSFDAAAQHRRSPLGDKKNRAREEDPVRRSKLKTEMCMHYENSGTCPFGPNCTYAHGEEELQMTRLVDLHRAGLVDLETYRIKPCLTWVSTGSCPFGKRCSCIHDPRSAGVQQSWLPHTETQGNTIATDINVEALHQKRLHAIQFNNPFGDLLREDMVEWDDVYKLVCNIPTKELAPRRKRAILAEHHKVDIAIQMRGAAGWSYKFRPQHIIYDELCMVLQKRAFRLTDVKAIEIPLNVYNSKKLSNQVLVREIAFGPDCDPSVRGVSLWFDIADSDVTVCTPQQAKRYRWKKGIKSRDGRTSPYQLKPKSSAFESRDCFVMVCALDNDAYDLSTDILNHRLGTLRAERIAGLAERWAALSIQHEQSGLLKERFENIKRHWQTWAWPINDGRAKVNNKTPVPPVDGKYSPCPKIDDDIDEDNKENRSVAVQRVWESFITNTFPSETTKQISRRLAVFEVLANGKPTSSDSRRPHILKYGMLASTERDLTSDAVRCWKALLLTPPRYPATYEMGENVWEIVHQHFSNGRSKKVLSILQSQ